MAGIDYGMGKTNINEETGIRYGVISMHEVCQAWSDSSEGDYGEPSCPKCGNAVEEYDDEQHGEYKPGRKQGCCCDYACTDCEIILDSDMVTGDEAVQFVLDDDGYLATQSHDDSDIFIIKSPYFTKADFCSPCAPGACHLNNPSDDGERAYCFGHDWFDSNKAPYPVYSVETGELVPAPSE